MSTQVAAPEAVRRRTAEDYLASLRDGRRVVYDGQVVADITRHPQFAGAARTLAGVLDLESDPDYATATIHPGTAVPWMYSDAASADDVRTRRLAYTAMARRTGGLLGRSPDFIATMVTSWAAAAPAFGDAEDSIRRYHEESRARQLCHAHAIVDPPAARHGGDETLRLRVVAENEDGIHVSGMKMMATLAPFADDLLIYPWGRPLAEEERDHAVAFAVPLATPGLSVLCRPGHTGGQLGDRPLANRFDEMDAMCVFDRAFVPWERVFLFRDVELANSLHLATSMLPYIYHQAAARTVVKAEFCLAVARLTAEAAGKNDPGTADALGEAAAQVRSLQALVEAAEAGARRDEHGWWVADVTYLMAVPALNLTLTPRLVELIRTITASAAVLLPTVGDAAGPHADLYATYFATPSRPASEHMALLRLAADLVASGFGARQDLFERYYLGPPSRVRGNVLRGYDDTTGRAMVEALLAP